MTMKQWKVTDLISLVAFGLFAVFVLLVLLTGADVYRNLVDRGDTHFRQRTVSQYLATRIRQGDDKNKISLENFEGVDALVIREEIRGKTYLTRVYCYDGWLRELFTGESSRVSPEHGEKILEVETLSLSLENGMLFLRITLPDGSVQERMLYLRSGKEAG